MNFVTTELSKIDMIREIAHSVLSTLDIKITYFYGVFDRALEIQNIFKFFVKDGDDENFSSLEDSYMKFYLSI